MEIRRIIGRALVVLLSGPLLACMNETSQPPSGGYAVGSTNMEIAPEYADMGDDLMHQYMLGLPGESGEPRFLVDILKHREAAWVTDIAVPSEPDVYGPASGTTLPVVTFVTYPTAAPNGNRYPFPYFNAQYGAFEHMLKPGESPNFADANAKYPLILLAHGSGAHGLYDVRHAHSLSAQGYIVAVITYGDDRTAVPNELNPHAGFLRPLITSRVLDTLLESDTFGPHIDADNIGITGHSYGGFTALAIAGGPYQGNDLTVRDDRIKAGVLAAPWVGGRYQGQDVFAFGPDNRGLNRVTAPMLCAYGSKDEVTLASFILPAMKQLSGPTYVVELVDQPHVFEGGSWQDRDNWELLFFDAYLKHDPAALESLKTTRSMPGGNEDVQLFDYQRVDGQQPALR